MNPGWLGAIPMVCPDLHQHLYGISGHADAWASACQMLSFGFLECHAESGEYISVPLQDLALWPELSQLPQQPNLG